MKSFRLCPVRVAISLSVHPAIASLVAAAPFKSRNVSPTMPAAAQALRQDAPKPSKVHGWPSLFRSITGLVRAAASSMALSGAPTGITTLRLLWTALAGSCFRRKLSTSTAISRLGAVRPRWRASAASADEPVPWRERPPRHRPSKSYRSGIRGRVDRP
jgi:hypothetical protein